MQAETPSSQCPNAVPEGGENRDVMPRKAEPQGIWDNIMSNFTQSLADLDLELTIRPVVDDLDGLARRLDRSALPEQAYASFAALEARTMEAAARALAFAGEISRFMALAGTSSKKQVAVYFDQPLALTFLNAASVLTVALTAPRQPRDFAARRRILADLLASVGDDPVFTEAAALAFAHGYADVADSRNLHLLPALVPGENEVREEPAAIGLEQGLSLAFFVKELPPPTVQIAQAVQRLTDAEGFAAAISHRDLDQETLECLERARSGAMLLGAAALCRAHLIVAITSDDQRGELAAVADRILDDRLRGIVRLARLMADRLRELRKLRVKLGDLRLI